LITGRVIAREYESPSSSGSHTFGVGILDPRAKGMSRSANVVAQSNGLPVYSEREI
jgi:hypothetical protein